MRMRRSRWVLGLLMLVATPAVAQPDPRVPPGLDPGGVAVALISTGIDYTLPQLAGRLARDGEGEIIGWDFADGDQWPFATRQAGAGTALARIIIGEAPDARLIAVRVDPEQPGSLMRAMAFVGMTPAQIVLVAVDSPFQGDLGPFREAARHFNRLLIIVPADGESPALAEAASSLDNALVVAAADGPQATGAVMTIAPPASAAADQDGISASPDTAAAARAAGGAAGDAARAPSRDGAGLKQAVRERAR